MCLELTTTEPTHQGVKTAWKVVILWCERKLISEYFNYTWKPGLCHSGRRSTELEDFESDCKKVLTGFHVYTHRAWAERGAESYNRYYVAKYAKVMEVQVDSADFVAANDNAAVYTKVRLSEAEFQRIMKCEPLNY